MMPKSWQNMALDLLFPRRCPWCGEVMGFAVCACAGALTDIELPDGPLPLHREAEDFRFPIWACYTYQYPAANAVWRLKSEGRSSAYREMAASMARKCEECGLQRAFDVMVPVPISPRGLKERGYNQALLLAQQLSLLTGIALGADVLQKPQETYHQRQLGRSERLRNLQGAFRVKDTAAVQGKRVLLVDDVVTTGSTLLASAEVLLQAGAAGCGGLCFAATAEN